VFDNLANKADLGSKHIIPYKTFKFAVSTPSGSNQVFFTTNIIIIIDPYTCLHYWIQTDFFTTDTITITLSPRVPTRSTLPSISSSYLPFWVVPRLYYQFISPICILFLSSIRIPFCYHQGSSVQFIFSFSRPTYSPLIIGTLTLQSCSICKLHSRCKHFIKTSLLTIPTPKSKQHVMYHCFEDYSSSSLRNYNTQICQPVIT
jgi:hypothetical protein